MQTPSLIKEQISYYRARAEEYDAWFLRIGRYDRGEAHRRQWTAELDAIRGFLSAGAPLGDVLETLRNLGWEGEVHATEEFFLYGSVQRIG